MTLLTRPERVVSSPDDVAKALVQPLALPLALANPFWLAFGAAASAGAAWWLMTRWTRTMTSAASPNSGPAAGPDAAVEEALALVEAGAAEPEVRQVAAEAGLATPEASAIAAADDLTRLIGVGPRTAAALAKWGVTRFAELAAWSAEEMAAFDAALNLKGRSARDAWLDQARALVAEA